MKSKGLKIFHISVGVLISLSLIAASVCLILAAYSIYTSGDSPYTPESIKAQYELYKIPLLSAVGAVGVGILINLLVPGAQNKNKPIKDPFIRLRILKKKYAQATTDPNLTAAISKEQKRRVVLRVLCGILCAAAFVPAVLSLCDYSYHTVDNLTSAILRTAFWLAVGAAVSFVLLLVLSLLLDKSAESEIAKTKLAICDSDKQPPEKAVEKSRTPAVVLRFVLLAAACALIVLGSLDNGFYDVLQKAIRICTECIGLG